MSNGSDQETILMATMMNERYAVEEGEEEDDVSYTSFKTISTIKTSDGEQTICEEQHNTSFTSYQTISTVRTWNEEDDTQAEDSTGSPCVSQSSVISTCRKGVKSHDYYSGLSFKRSKVDESFFNLNQMNGTFQVLMDVEEHISGSSCGSCPDPSLKQARDPMKIKENRNEKLQVSISPKTAQRRLQQLTASAFVSPTLLYLSPVPRNTACAFAKSPFAPRCVDEVKRQFYAVTPVPVRREIQGLGVRIKIDALQQLISPFGKTDTASVLMESIDYINFLQQQIQVLLNWKGGGDIETDLKSRGLCLVPSGSGYTSTLM